MKYQSGKSFMGMMIPIIMGGMILAMLLKVLPVYMEFNSVDGILDAVGNERNITSYSQRQVWKLMKKRLDINGIDSIKDTDLSVAHKDGVTTITLYYEVRKPLVSNLDIVAKYDRTLTITAAGVQ